MSVPKEDPSIDPSFRKGKRKKLTTVADVIAELRLLPPKLRVIGVFGERVRVTVTNYNDKYLAAMFETDS